LTMTDYYFLATALPDLQLGYPPDITFQGFSNLLKANLSPEDYRKSIVMRRYYDIQNIRSFLKKEEIDFRGVFDENELEDAILTYSGFPDYVYDFLDHYENTEDRLHHFPMLISNYFKIESENATGFLHDYLTFEREWRLVLTGFRAKKMGRDLAEELQYEDPDDDIVMQILAQKDAQTYDPPDRYSDLKPLFDEHSDSPVELYQALCEYRYAKIEELMGTYQFSVDRVLGYLAQLVIVERWLELDKKKGLEIVDKIVKESS